MSFLLGISPASCSLRPTFRNTVSVPSSIGGEEWRKLQDAGEIPKRKLIINTTRRKLEIENIGSATQSLLMRAGKCIAAGGGHFEQLM